MVETKAVVAPPEPDLLVVFDHWCPRCGRQVYRMWDAAPRDPRGPCRACRRASEVVGRALEVAVDAEHIDATVAALSSDEMFDGLDKIRNGTHRKCETRGCLNLVEVVRRRGRPRKYCEVCRP